MASSTMSLKVRSSSFGGGIMGIWLVSGVGGAIGAVGAIGARLVVVLGLEVERIDEVARRVLAGDHVLDADVEPVGLVGIGPRGAGDLLDARLELVDRLLAVDLGARRGQRAVGGEHQVVDLAAVA